MFKELVLLLMLVLLQMSVGAETYDEKNLGYMISLPAGMDVRKTETMGAFTTVTYSETTPKGKPIFVQVARKACSAADSEKSYKEISTMAASDNTIKNLQLVYVGRWKAISYDTPGKNGAPPAYMLLVYTNSGWYQVECTVPDLNYRRKDMMAIRDSFVTR